MDLAQDRRGQDQRHPNREQDVRRTTIVCPSTVVPLGRPRVKAIESKQPGGLWQYTVQRNSQKANSRSASSPRDRTFLPRLGAEAMASPALICDTEQWKALQAHVGGIQKTPVGFDG